MKNSNHIVEVKSIEDGIVCAEWPLSCTSIEICNEGRNKLMAGFNK